MRVRHDHIIGLGLGAVVVGAAVAFVHAINFSPSFDAYGWLVWGHQAVYGSLNTGAAPSWKPLTFLFTVPYALAGSDQPRLWMYTATAAALAAPLFAARIALCICAPCAGTPYARWIAALCAAIGVAALGGYLHLVLIASSDPMVLALCLAAIDFHLRGHPRTAFVMVVLAALGRPEMWPFALAYSVWAWRAVPRMRIMLVVGILSLPACWFLIPALTSKSPFIAGKLALGFKDRIRGSKLDGTLTRFLNNSPWPFEIFWLAAILVGVIERDRTVLILAGAAIAWVIIEYAFALHGWPAVPRYLLEPAAVLTVLAAALIGRALAVPPGASVAWRAVAPLAILMLVVTLVPVGRERAQEASRLVAAARRFTTAIDRLHTIVVADGGAAAVLACGYPVTFVSDQSTLAWELGLNVGQVGHKPGRAIGSGRPIVLFQHGPEGWAVRPIHTTRRRVVSCRRILIEPRTEPT